MSIARDRSTLSADCIRAPFRHPAEEMANVATHLVGFLLSVAGLVLLLVWTARNNGGAIHFVSLSVYGATLMLTFLASTLYHSATGTRFSGAFEALDHTAIFLLIAGTYTPFSLVGLGGGWGWSLFGVVWGLALFGICFRLARRRHDRWIIVPIYLVMGWIGVVAIGEISSAVDPAGLFWLLLGGIIYSAGVAFYAWERLRFNHAIWHLFVLGGSACHFLAMVVIAVPSAV
ncbi:MAG: hemolysin III family protein [Pseudomonadota bacterium]